MEITRNEGTQTNQPPFKYRSLEPYMAFRRLTSSLNKCHRAIGEGREKPVAIKFLMVLNNSVRKVGC